MSTITVRVTQTHIDHGVPKSAIFCPIALAVEWPSDRFCVYPNHICADGKIALLPESARIFIDAYDDGLEVQPFEFELEVPE